MANAEYDEGEAFDVDDDQAEEERLAAGFSAMTTAEQIAFFRTRLPPMEQLYVHELEGQKGATEDRFTRSLATSLDRQAPVANAPRRSRASAHRPSPDDLKGEWRSFADAMQLNHRTVSDIAALFRSLDRDKSATIDRAEFNSFLDRFGIDRVAFGDRLFAQLDRDHSGGIDRAEFTLAILLFASDSLSLKLKFAFDTFDVDGRGAISVANVRSIVRNLMRGTNYSDDWCRQLASQLVNQMDTNADGTISFNEFSTACRKNPELLSIFALAVPELLILPNGHVVKVTHEEEE